ncbi:alanine racemase [Paracidobacterium acidisoli]|uniref:Alanine racemase n=1 Tax=Paracidobacterium acidisoli TaxID=2303751 RepID=A0A372IMB9_9BACT|nr:alanine racemase [Paracidobacterium acidisoli]MBT9331631.1 alanine racemase [Paracidobacterium acidisoli]
MTHTRPVWAEISRYRLIANYRLLRGLAGAETELLAVVKANAYGHGTTACANLLAAEGARWFGVTCVDEGTSLRSSLRQLADSDAPHSSRILVMSGIWKDEAETLIPHGLTPVAWEPWHLEWLESVTRRQNIAPEGFPVYLEIDTGMSRQGVRPENLDHLLRRFTAGSSLRLEGVMTHFHSPEELGASATQDQTGKFVSVIDTIYERGLKPEILSAGNSATLLAQKETDTITNIARRYGMQLLIRPGLSLYGYAPRFTGAAQPSAAASLQPVLAWKTRIVSMRTIVAGESAGYNATFRASRPTHLALLPVGYADGLNRLLSNKGGVLIRGKRAPIAGRISMDQTVIDVTEIPGAEIGDEAVLIGQQGGETITAYDLADLAGTIPYETLCGISARVPRVMVD